MEENFHFVNKSASDIHLSHSDSREGFHIRQFIQKRNRLAERIRKNGITSVPGPARPMHVAYSTIVLNSATNGNPRTGGSNYSICCKDPRTDRITTSLYSLRKSLSERNSWPEAEQRGVQYFTNIISTNFTTVECSAFWCICVPCGLHQDAAVRLLVTAFALLHEAHDIAATDLQRTQRCEALALVHYNKAIDYIREYGGSMKKSMLVMTCILVVTIETLRGELVAAETCITSGLAITGQSKTDLLMYRWTYPILRAESAPADRAIQVVQGKMSAAFDVFSIRPKSPNCEFILGTNASSLVGQIGFGTTEDVNTLAEKLTGATLRALERLQNEHRMSRDSSVVIATLRKFEEFHYKLNSFRCSAGCPSAIAQRSRWTIVQEMKVLEAEIVFHNIVLDYDEMSFDKWTVSFERILDIALCCFESDTADFRHLVYHPFSFLFVPALWLVASRCRVPGVRRRAIDLLQKYPRREKIFDSVTASEIARNIVFMEESTEYRPKICEDISYANRVTLQGAEYLPTSNCIQLTYLRGKQDNKKIVQEHITWFRTDAKSDTSGRGSVLNSLLQALLVYSRVGIHVTAHSSKTRSTKQA